ERKKIHNRLRAIENEMERIASRGFRYLVAICIGVAAILAWQSYSEAAKQVIGTRVPELGWSPEAKQRIAGWVQQLGWTKPSAVESKTVPGTQTAPVAAKQPIAAVRQAVERHLADVRATVEGLAASQDQMAREIEKLQAANREILEKIPTPPPKRPA